MLNHHHHNQSSSHCDEQNRRKRPDLGTSPRLRALQQRSLRAEWARLIHSRGLRPLGADAPNPVGAVKRPAGILMAGQLG